MFKLKLVRNALALLTVISLLSSCGFHLRGNIPLPEGIKNMFIDAPSGTFKDKLEEVVENGGAVMASSPKSADVVLKVTKASSNRVVGTLDERGKADSYTLYFSVSYVLTDAKGKQLRDASLRESRQYNFDPELVIESESEEAELLSNMEEDIALRIVRQLSTVTDLDE